MSFNSDYAISVVVDDSAVAIFCFSTVAKFQTKLITSTEEVDIPLKSLTP